MSARRPVPGLPDLTYRIAEHVKVMPDIALINGNLSAGVISGSTVSGNE